MPTAYTSSVSAGDPPAVNLADLTARFRRLDQLSRGLARELTIIRKADDPMLYLERRAYLMAMHDALCGVEEARITLAKACQRLTVPR
jgi:hypothetical protein